MPARKDIQALRGLAVLMVVLYHFGVGPVRAGYLGVDVFFVISGFLITGLIATGIQQGHFSLPGFYIRRAKRLLPAAYVTIALTVVAAHWLLDGQELRDLSSQVIGAVTFTANIVLWQQAGYFDSAADLKPLLHTWSLSLEEQFYLLVPAAMIVTPRRLWLPMAAASLLASLGLCLVGMLVKPIATFYLLPTRAWELLVGSVGALAVRIEGSPRPLSASPAVRALFYPSLVALVALPAFPIGGSHPGLAAILACAATLTVVLRHHEGFERSRVTRTLAVVGDFSYSLYLVHWPILALLRNAWGNPSREIPLSFRATALVLSVVVAYALYRLVERPIHQSRLSFSPRLAGGLAVSSLSLVLLTPLMLFATNDSATTESRRLANHGFSKQCDFDGLFTPDPACRSQTGAKVLVWGDSFAMHLVLGLDAEGETGGVIQATMNTCGPFLDIAPVQTTVASEHSLYDRAWAKRCIAFNDSVLDFVRKSKDVEIVVLSSLLTAYTDPTGWQRLERDQGQMVLPVTLARTGAAIMNTAMALRAAGKKVVLIAPPALAKFDVGVCLERRRAGRIALGVDHCQIDASEYRLRRRDVLSLLDTIKAQGLPVVSFDAWLCGPEVCTTTLDGIAIYRDYGHFSVAGSKQLAKKVHLGRLVNEDAR